MNVIRERLYGTERMKARQRAAALRGMEQVLATLPEPGDSENALLERSRLRGHRSPLALFESGPVSAPAKADHAETGAGNSTFIDTDVADMHEKDPAADDYYDGGESYIDPEPFRDRPLFTVPLVAGILVAAVSVAVIAEGYIADYVGTGLYSDQRGSPQQTSETPPPPVYSDSNPATYTPPNPETLYPIPQPFK